MTSVKKSLSAFVFLVSSFIEDFFFIPIQQKNETKKVNTLLELKYLLFCSSIDLLDAKGVIFKSNLTDCNLIRKCV